MATIETDNLARAKRVFLGPTNSEKAPWPYHKTTLAKKHIQNCAQCKSTLAGDRDFLQKTLLAATTTANESITNALSTSGLEEEEEWEIVNLEFVTITCDPSSYAEAPEKLHPAIAKIATHIIADFANSWQSQTTLTEVARVDEEIARQHGANESRPKIF